MRSHKCSSYKWIFILGLGFLLPGARPVWAQGTGGPMVSDSKAGYIDSAILGDVLRFRYDSTYGNRRPSRAEFFYAQGAPGGPGLPFPEPRVDYQDFMTYAEFMWLPNLSGFVEIGARMLNPEVNANTAGLADMNAGLRYALFQNDVEAVTLQLRTYAPSGDAQRGLGTRHASVEPALLWYHSLGARAGLESELRYWVPAGGTSFAGDVIRYGVGGYFEVYRDSRLRISPVVELVGWTVLSGKESVVMPDNVVQVQDAAGDTIVNGKFGLRVGIGENIDLYGGYGRAFTGDRWYDDTLRFELRWQY